MGKGEKEAASSRISVSLICLESLPIPGWNIIIGSEEWDFPTAWWGGTTMTPQSQGQQRHGYVFIPWISRVIESTVLEVVSQRVINNKKTKTKFSLGQKRHLVSAHVHDAGPASTIRHTLCWQLWLRGVSSKLTTIQATYAFNFQGRAEVPQASRWQLSRVPV